MQNHFKTLNLIDKSDSCINGYQALQIVEQRMQEMTQATTRAVQKPIDFVFLDL